MKKLLLLSWCILALALTGRAASFSVTTANLLQENGKSTSRNVTYENLPKPLTYSGFEFLFDKGSASAGAGREFTGEQQALFERLRTLRMEIARMEKVPPYIIFSDKTLTHMCMVKPGTKEEMLSVSGVGEYKYEKYGERFLACVRENGGQTG